MKKLLILITFLFISCEETVYTDSFGRNYTLDCKCVESHTVPITNVYFINNKPMTSISFIEECDLYKCDTSYR